MAIVKEHDGQVKTPEERARGQDASADNEMDGDDAIKLYDELVKSPQDRLALEKETPRACDGRGDPSLCRPFLSVALWR